MVQPLTLLQQMKMVAQQFLGLVPTGSYYDFNGVLYKVDGMDPTTGKIILNPVTSGSTTLMDPIAALYPNAVPAPVVNAALKAATGGGLGFQGILSTGMTGLQALTYTKMGKGGPAKGNIVQETLKLDPSLVGPGGHPLPTSLDAAMKTAGDAQTAVDNAQEAVNKLFDSNSELFKTLHKQAEIDVLNSIDTERNLVNRYQQDIDKLTAGVDPLRMSDSDEVRQLMELRDQHASQLENLKSHQMQDINNKFDGYIEQAQKNLDLARVNSENADIASNFASVNETIRDGHSDLFNSLSAQQKQDFLFDAESQLKQSGVKSPTMDQIQQLAEKNLAVNLQLTPEDFVALKDIAVQNAIDNNPSLVKGTPEFDAAVRKEMSDLIDPANLTDPNNTNNDLVNYIRDHKSMALLQKEESKYRAALRSEAIQAGIELGAAAGAGYAEENAISEMFAKGFSGKQFITAITSGFGMYIALHLVNNILMQQVSPLADKISSLMLFGKNIGGPLEKSLEFLTSGYGFLAIQGLLVLLGWLFSRKPPPEQLAAETLNQEVNPLVWNPNGQVIFLTAGLTMATLGINLSPSAPMMQTMTLSQAAATDMLLAAGASQVPTDGTRYADVFVEQGGIGQPTRVVYLTPAGVDKNGKPIETLTVQTLNKNFQFAQSQPPTGFIPFFIPGPGGKVIANPQVVQNLSNQQHLLLCADGAWVTDASLCAAAAGAASHSSGGH